MGMRLDLQWLCVRRKHNELSNPAIQALGRHVDALQLLVVHCLLQQVHNGAH